MNNLVHSLRSDSIPLAAALTLALAIALSLTVTVIVIWYQERSRRA